MRPAPAAARRIAASVVVLGLAWAVAGCQSAPVPGHALNFEESVPLDPRGWTIAGPADRWVLVAADDAELSELLAETAVPDHPGQDPEPQVAPPIPEGQTALLYYVGYRPHSGVHDSTVGVYESDGEWVVAVQRKDLGYGDDALFYERHLVFVDAPPPASVRLRFEDTSQQPPEVTWW